jgi:hypothetical protein
MHHAPCTAVYDTQFAVERSIIEDDLGLPKNPPCQPRCGVTLASLWRQSEQYLGDQFHENPILRHSPHHSAMCRGPGQCCAFERQCLKRDKSQTKKPQRVRRRLFV